MKNQNANLDSNYLTHIYFKASRSLRPGEGAAFAASLSSLAGIEEFTLLPDKIVISYYSYFITGDYIKETLTEAGYPMAENDRRRKSTLQKFLEKISESNKRVFSDDSLPACCRPGN